MAGANKQEFRPLLPPGFHPHDLEGLKRLCVDRFTRSITRQRILNPDDVDLILVVDKATFQGCDDAARKFMQWFRENNLYSRYRCDNYFFINDNGDPRGEYQYAYWLRQFGFSRGHQMKGLAVISCPFVVKP